MQPLISTRALVAAAFSSVLALNALHAETVVVTGSREPLAPDRLAGDVVVIDAERIRASSADSLPDLLRREAGVQLSRSGGPGHGSGVLIRGANSGQTVLLVDGVRVGSATLGLPSLDGLALAQIERIEVLRGPGSSLFGADAIGGVVQVFTRRGGDGTGFDAQALVGGYGSVQTAAGVRGGSGGWDAAASVSHDQSEGVSVLRPGDAFGNHNPDRDGYRLDTAQAQLGWRPAAGHRVGLVVMRSRLNVQYDASEFPPPTYAQDNSPDFRDIQRVELVALDWRGTLAPALTGSARVDRGSDDSRSGGREIARFHTRRSHASAQLAWDTGAFGQLVGAVEHGTEKASASGFATDPVRRNDAFVAALHGQAGAWAWQADARRDRSSDFGSVDSARLGASVELRPGWRLRGLAGTTFRAPSFNDLYYPGYGVPTLRPERGRSAEVGLVWRGDTGEAAATLFRNRVGDLVAYEPDRTRCPPDPAYDFGCARNINRARLDGATLSARQRHGAWALQAQVDLLNARDAVSGERLNRRAAHQETLGAEWTGGDWRAGANVLRLGARPDGGKALAAETTLDLTAGWRFAHGWSLLAKLLNATDRDTEPVRDYQGLGRQAWLGVRYEGGR